MMISVVVAAYRVEAYVQKCLESISRQTYRDFEAIVVLDGAADNTPAICRAFAREDSRFVVVERENGGLAAARNTGLEHCRGEYIAFVDSDDAVAPDFLSTLIGAMQESGSDIAACGYVREDENGGELYHIDREKAIMSGEEFLNSMLIPINRSYGAFVWNKLYKAQIIREHQVRFPEQRVLFEDHWFNYQYMKYAESGCYAPACPYRYILRSNTGLVINVEKNQQNIEKWLHYTDVFDAIIDDPYQGFDEFKGQIRIMKAWHCATAVRVLAYLGACDSAKYQEMRRYIRKQKTSYLKTPYIGNKKKLGLLLSCYMPRLAYRLWSH